MRTHTPEYVSSHAAAAAAAAAAKLAELQASALHALDKALPPILKDTDWHAMAVLLRAACVSTWASLCLWLQLLVLAGTPVCGCVALGLDAALPYLRLFLFTCAHFVATQVRPRVRPRVRAPVCPSVHPFFRQRLQLMPACDVRTRCLYPPQCVAQARERPREVAALCALLALVTFVWRRGYLGRLRRWASRKRARALAKVTAAPGGAGRLHGCPTAHALLVCEQRVRCVRCVRRAVLCAVRRSPCAPAACRRLPPPAIRH